MCIADRHHRFVQRDEAAQASGGGRSADVKEERANEDAPRSRKSLPSQMER